jgi:micrococcal nuclease
LRSKPLPKSQFNRNFGFIAVLLITYLLILIAGIVLGGLIQRKATIIINGSANCQEKGIVDTVIDGDTIILKDGRTIRYLGINTPETNHPTKGLECFGAEATIKNNELVNEKKITLECGNENIDEYGRYLRYVYVDDIFINAELVEEGFAVAFPFGQTEKLDQVFVQLENYSRLQNKGMWKACVVNK